MSFWQTDLGILIITIGKTLAIVVPVLIGMAYLTLAERKVLAAIQIRKGPNVVGPFGLWQPFADASQRYMRNHIDLDTLEAMARFPAVTR